MGGEIYTVVGEDDTIIITTGWDNDGYIQFDNLKVGNNYYFELWDMIQGMGRLSRYSKEFTATSTSERIYSFSGNDIDPTSVNFYDETNHKKLDWKFG